MKKEINPIVTAGAVILAIIGVIIYGYRAMQPAPYLASPGVAGRPGVQAPTYARSGDAGRSPLSTHSGRENTLPPTGAVPGMPPSAITSDGKRSEAANNH